MLQIYCKKNIKELLSGSTLDLPQQRVIEECQKAFETKMRLVEFALDNNYYYNQDEVKLTDDYIEFEQYTHNSYAICVGMINDMKKTNKIDYKFLDLVLYNAIYIYQFTNKYDLSEFDELVLPPANAILNHFWNDLNKDNFPNSYSYFLNDLSTQIQLDADVVTNICDLFTYNIGNLLKFRSGEYILTEDTLIKYLKSYYYITKNHVRIKMPKEDLITISKIDFTSLKEEDLKEIIELPKSLFNPFIDNVKDNEEIIETIIKNVFTFIEQCSNIMEDKKDNDDYITVDSYCYESGSLWIEKKVKEMPLNHISQCYADDIDYDTHVNAPLRKLLQVAYSREYTRKCKDLINMLKSKTDVGIDLDIPF